MNKVAKNNTKKIMVILLIVTLCNFIVPTCIYAINGGVLFKYGVPLMLMIPDLLLQKLQFIFIGEELDIGIKDPKGGISNYSIMYSPGVIFSGSVPALDVNFISPMGINGVVEFKRKTYRYDEIGEIKESWEQGLKFEDLFEDPYNLVMEDATEGVNMSDTTTYVLWFGRDVAYITWTNEQGRTFWLHTSTTLNMPVTMYLIGALLVLGGLVCAIKTGGASLKVSAWGVGIFTGTVVFNKVLGSLSAYFTGGTLYELIPGGTITSKRVSIAYTLRKIVGTYYKTMQEIALVVLLSVLVYVAIRMILSSTSKDKAKYKQMMGHWLVAVCILFMLHFFISMTLTSIQNINEIFANVVIQNDEDVLMTAIRNSVGFDPNNEDLSKVFADVVIYIVLVTYTIQYTFIYLKRVIHIAFLIIISPMVAFTYAIDKMKDGKAQALGLWIKEFSFNALMQPIHMLLYFIFVYGAMTLAKDNFIYTLVMIGFLKPGEKFVRKLFGLEQDSSLGKMASALGGAAMMNSIKNMGKNMGKNMLKRNGSGGGEKDEKTKVRTSNSQDGDAYDSLRDKPESNENDRTEGTNPSSPNKDNEEKRNIKKGSKVGNGAWKVARKYVLNKKTGMAIARGTGKVAGAATLGTLGLAAGIATGEGENVIAGLTGGIAAGKRVGGGLVDGGANLVQGATDGINGVRDTFGEGFYGEDEYAKMKANREFQKTSEYKKLIGNYEGQEGDIEAFVNAGITDAGKMGTALKGIQKGDYNAQEAIAYMKMAEKCPEEILYDTEKFKEYLKARDIPEGKAEQIRKGIVAFK